MIPTIPLKLRSIPVGSAHFTGALNDAVLFVQDHQLKDVTFWKETIEVFRHPGIDDPNMGWRGEFWGKMMRGAVLTYSYTGDEELYKIMVDAIEDMLSTQQESGRFSTYSELKELQEWDTWSRKYVMLGFIYFIEVCKDKELIDRIIKAVMRHADYILDRVGPGKEKTITQTSLSWRGLNSSSILEPFVRLYVITGEKRYFDFATHIVDNGGVEDFNLFEEALSGKDYPYQYQVVKAYEMMSCFEGIEWYYRVTKEPKYFEMVKRFADKIIDSDVTIVGSSGCAHECFDHSKITQFDPASVGLMQETCVTVTWMKFCYLLYQNSGDVKYMREIERSAYNALLGAINTRHNVVLGQVPTYDSYSPLRKSARGQGIGGCMWLIPEKFYTGCCISIGSAGTALTGICAINEFDKGYSFDLYQEGSANLDDGKFRVQINTNYPSEETITFNFSAENNHQILRFRIPDGKSTIKVITKNSKKVKTSDGYWYIEKDWNTGDQVIITADLSIRVLKDVDLWKPAAFRPVRYACLTRGPIALTLDELAQDHSEALSETISLSKDALASIERVPMPFSDVLPPVSECFKLVSNGKNYYFTDYASSGKVWDNSDRISVWFSFTSK